MGEFHLSPGITPELVGAVVVAFPLLVGLLYAIDRRRGVAWAFGLTALGLGLIKLGTDYSDPGDLALALAAEFGGLVLLYETLPPASRPSGPTAFLGGVVAGFGAIKVVRDFYDPFDLLLAAVMIVVGGWLSLPYLAARVRPRPAPRS